LRLLTIVDEAGFAHAPEHDPAPLQGQIRIHQGE
jgi:hypothetical protein